MTSADIQAEFRRAGQGQVFAFLDRLSAGGRDRLLAEAAEIDLAEVARLTTELVTRALRGQAGIGRRPGRMGEGPRGRGGGPEGRTGRRLHGGRGAGHASRV